MAKPIIVTRDKWRDAVKFLMGLGVNPTLTAKDQRRLRECLRGPFANGMTAAEARAMLWYVIGWESEGGGELL